MTASLSQYTCPASMLAKSLLDVWLSGDRYRLRMELQRVTGMAVFAETDDEAERLELLKSMAWGMREASDLFTPRSESPRIGTWLDLLCHLSTDNSPVN